MSDAKIDLQFAHKNQDALGAQRHLGVLEPNDDGIVICDVVVIGSGMGGSTFANAIKDKELNVIVVERGDFLTREIQNWDANAVFGQKRYHNAETWLDSQNNSFSPGVFYYVGGNTKFYGAMLPRFRKEDFEEIQHAEGISPAWPITYDDLEPYYARAEEIYNVHGNKGEDPTESWRSTDYPSKGLTHDPALTNLAQNMREQGLHPFSMPAAVDYGQNRPCVRCSTCDGYPCLIDAKGDAEVSALRPAVAKNKIKLLVRTRIDQLITTDDGKEVIEAIGKRDEKVIRIFAKKFILACGAVNTAALLLKSKNNKHPNGLGNSSDLLGRNYMVHNSTFMIACAPFRLNTVLFQKTLAVNDWYFASEQNKFPLGNIQMLGKIREPMITAMRPWLPKFISRYITDHSVDLYLTSEDLPQYENRVVYDEVQEKIKVHWTPNNLKAHFELVKKASEMMKKAHYPIVLKEKMGIATNSHQCGTAVMGHDPSKSVVNTQCRLHDVNNVWLVDSSSFVSSAAVNPALTIAANALRVADNF
ncbi:dehydrogenase [Acinetobacter sp. ANC 4558]|uniref:GMC oxidoreductase n=1 Tax=Acinetobacter sp. ANC 4558 TaxID=1977876 RepID=UPI000A34960A|nr:GMC family oxidoreductase [Acinetobacter sp. ANC 4558]OTG86321.1 dehydrogenase [Acinetobacter sp. ANC 4558]